MVRYITAIFFLAALLVRPAFSQIHFDDVTAAAGLHCLNETSDRTGGGVIVFDYNGDGWDDILCLGGQHPDSLFVNNGDGTFTDWTVKANIRIGNRKPRYTHGGVAFDYDKDGHPDLYITCLNGSDQLYHNDGNGVYSDVTGAAGIIVPSGTNDDMTATFGDFNGDGYPDVYVARWINDAMPQVYDTALHRLRFVHTTLPNWLYVNNGNGTFTESAKALGVSDTGTGLIALFIDYDQDGDLDLIVGNDFGYDIQPNAVYKNLLMETGTATFTNVAADIGLRDSLFCMGIAAGDPDRTGQFSFFETNIGPVKFKKNVGGYYYDSTDAKHLQLAKIGFNNTFDATSWSSVFDDFDNDGWDDLYVVHGIQEISAPWFTTDFDTTRFYKNMGGVFSEVTHQSGIVLWERGKGGAELDYNHDGKVDLLFTANTNPPVNPSIGVHLFKNTSEATGHWIEFKMIGRKGIAEAIGTTLHAWAGGVDHLRQVTTGGVYLSTNSLTQHIGLGEAGTVDSLIVMWPAYVGPDHKPTRTIERYYNIPADQIKTIAEGDATAGVEANEQSMDKIFVSPAIASSYVTVSGVPLGATLDIVDVTGRQIWRGSATTEAPSISVANLPTGVYYLRATSAGGARSARFIREGR